MNQPDSVVLMGAVRRLSVDIANLTTQLALLQANVETVLMASDGISPEQWSYPGTDGGTGNNLTPVSIPVEQAQQIQALLVAIHRLV